MRATHQCSRPLQTTGRNLEWSALRSEGDSTNTGGVLPEARGSLGWTTVRAEGNAPEPSRCLQKEGWNLRRTTIHSAAEHVAEDRERSACLTRPGSTAADNAKFPAI